MTILLFTAQFLINCFWICQKKKKRLDHKSQLWSEKIVKLLEFAAESCYVATSFCILSLKLTWIRARGERHVQSEMSWNLADRRINNSFALTELFPLKCCHQIGRNWVTPAWSCDMSFSLSLTLSPPGSTIVPVLKMGFPSLLSQVHILHSPNDHHFLHWLILVQLLDWGIIAQTPTRSWRAHKLKATLPPNR